MPKKVSGIRSKSPRTANSDTEAAGLPAGFAWTPGQRICIVTTEFQGLHKNGGIGTANTGLAIALAEAGLTVTVLYANPADLADDELQRVQAYYRGLQINLECLAPTPAFPKPFDHSRAASYAVYLYLCEREFDVIYFHDNGGRGFYPSLAKHTGCFPYSALMLVVAHGPIEWVHEINSLRYQDIESVIMAYLERRSVELADALISPSRYMVDWMAARQWMAPAHVFVEQNIVRTPAGKDGSPLSTPPVNVRTDEIVFFGRLEVRKGLALFCDTIDCLQQRAEQSSNLRITFLGKFAHVDGLHSGIYLTERSSRWSNRLRILANLDQSEALRYLCRPGVLAVMPSLVENSPCVVVECLRLGIPFIATNSGGTAELIDPEDCERCLTSADPEMLADRISAAVKIDHLPAALAMSPSRVAARWAAFHQVRPAGRRSAVSTAVVSANVGNATEPPLVSVCLFNGGETSGTRELLGALRQQTYLPLEIVLAEKGGDLDEDFNATARAGLGQPIVVRRVATEDAGDSPAALRAAAARAGGDFLLFLDQRRVTLLDDSIEVLVRAARRTGADVVTGFPVEPEDGGPATSTGDGCSRSHHCFPVGACLAAGVLENCFGEGLALVSRRVLEVVDHVPADDGAMSGYWQFFAACVVAGCRFEVVPRPLFRYHANTVFDLRKTRLLENYRSLINIYGQTKITLIRNILENLVDVDAEHRERLRRALSDLKDDRREAILKVSALDPNSRDAVDEVLRHLLERGRVEEALEFALSNNDDAGSAIRLVMKETVIEFARPASESWKLELQLGGAVSIDQLRRVAAFLGDRPLFVEAKLEMPGRGGALITITGDFDETASPEVKVRVLLPYAHSIGDPSQGAGFAIHKVAIKAFSLPPQAAAIGTSGGPASHADHLTISEEKTDLFSLSSKTISIAVPPAADAANTGNGILLSVSYRDDRAARFSRTQLDESYQSANYSHLDISATGVSIADEYWQHIKFKFCLSVNQRALEFREMPDWPTMFVAFPSDRRDAYGLVAHFGEEDVLGVASWPSNRDRLLIQAAATLLPAMVEAAAQTVPDYNRWVAEAQAYARSVLEKMRQLRLGTFTASDAASVETPNPAPGWQAADDARSDGRRRPAPAGPATAGSRRRADPA